MHGTEFSEHDCGTGLGGGTKGGNWCVTVQYYGLPEKMGM